MQEKQLTLASYTLHSQAFIIFFSVASSIHLLALYKEQMANSYVDSEQLQ
jgi:hypothetical protein